MHVDQTLLQASKRGDEKALYQLYQLCYGTLHSVASRYAVDEDESCTLINSAFMKIVKGISKYRASVPFEAWIRRIMINAAIDHHRKNRKYRNMITYEEKLPEFKDVHIDYNVVDKLFDAEQLKSMIKELPPMSATVFNLFAIDGYSHKEISKMLSIKEGTSKWHLSHARSKLQDRLKGQMKTASGSYRSTDKGEKQKHIA